MIFWLRNRQRRRQLQQNLSQLILRRFSTLLALILLHVVAMMTFEGMSFEEGIWLTFTTLSTTGYGDLSAGTTLGRLSTVVMLYIFGIGLFATIIGDVQQYRYNRRELIRQGKWDFKMKNHVLIINLPNTGRDRYLHHMVTELRSMKQFDDVEFQILASDIAVDDIPESIKAQGFYVNVGSGSRTEDLQLVHADKAQAILILCPDPHNPSADDVTAAVVHRLRSTLKVQAPIIAETANDANRTFILENGATATTRATNDYPEIIVKALAVPGSQILLEDFFQREGTDLCQHAFDGSDGESWKDCASRLLAEDIVLLGYLDNQGKTHRLGTSEMLDVKHLLVLKPEVKLQAA